MNWLVILLTFSCLFLVAIPTLFRLLFIYVLGFNQAVIKLKHPFNFVGLFLQLVHPMWGISIMSIYIPSILIKLQLRSLKLSIILHKPKLMLNRSFQQQLEPIKMLDSNQQPKILKNLITILQNQKNKPINNITTTTTTIQQNKQQFSHHNQNRLLLALRAALQFILLLLLQFIDVRMQETQVCLVTALPNVEKELVNRNSYRELREMLMLQECVTQQLVNIPKLNVSATIQRKQKLQILIQCPIVRILTSRHMQQTLLLGQQISIQVHFPVTFSMTESIRRMRIKINLQNIRCSVTPLDIEDIFHIINQITFKFNHIHKPQNKQTSKKTGSQQKNMGFQNQEIGNNNLTISVRVAEIRLKELGQADYDTKQAMKYLSNIGYAVLNIQGLSIKQDDIRISHSKLSIHKYHSFEQNQSTLDLQFNKNNLSEKQLIHRDILELNNLSIVKQSKRVTIIEHDYVLVTCQKEEVALLGKLFVLVNQRLSCQEYLGVVYEKQLGTVQEYLNGKIDLQECIIRIEDQTASSRSQQPQPRSQTTLNHQQSPQKPSHIPQQHQTNTLLYNPKQIQFLMNISQLQHRISLTSSKYKQSRFYNPLGKLQINHQLTFTRIHMQYQGIKQFHVNDFKLFYNQSPEEKELSILVEEMHMGQNYQTLKDYLVGFVIFKQLLQLGEGDEDQGEEERGLGKVSKKTVRLGRIVLNYADQVFIVNKLQVDKEVGVNGKLNQLYFSLGKCQFIMSKVLSLKSPKKPHQHTLFSLASVTIKTFLTTQLNTIEQQQKSMIHIKSPSMMLPQTELAQNVSERLINYLKIFNRLQLYLTAYIMNKSKEKVRMMRNDYKKFMNNASYLLIKITNINIGIQDSFLNRSMLNRSRFYREYYSHSRNYNQSQLLNYLRQTLKTYNLVQLKIQTVSLQIKPIKQLLSMSEQSVQKWVRNLKSEYSRNLVSQHSESRLIRAKNIQLHFQLKFLVLTVRDYPLPLVMCSFVKGSLQRVTSKNIYEEIHYYVRSKAKIGDLEVNVGLCLLSGLREVSNNLRLYEQALNRYKNTGQFLESVKLKKNLDNVKYKPYWHIMHKSSCWSVLFEKQEQILVKVLTGLTPYSQKHLQIVLGPLQLSSNPIQTSISLNFYKLSTNNHKILQLSKQILNLQTTYLEPFLQLSLSIQITSTPSTTNSLSISDTIIKDLSTIKQLKNDWLIIYNLVTPQTKKQADILHTNQQNQAKYLHLFEMAANHQLKNKQQQLSIFSVVKNVKMRCLIQDFYFELSDARNCVQFVFDCLKIDMKSDVKFQEWRMRNFQLGFDNILGKVKMLKGVDLTSKLSQKKFLQLFRQISQQQLKQYIHDKQIFKQVFFVARKVSLNLRKFGYNQNRELIYMYKCLKIENIKLQISIQLKKVIEYLMQTLIFEANKKISQYENKKQFFKRTPIQKFRQAVILVMRMNRRKKKLIRNLQMFVQIQNIQIGLRTSKRLLLLTTRQKGVLSYNTHYFDKDRYHIDPRIKSVFAFSGIQIWVDGSPNHLWLFGKKYSPKHYLKAQRILNAETVSFKIQKQKNQQIPQQYQQIVQKQNIRRETHIDSIFQKGSIQLNHDNLWILREISGIMVDLVDNRQKQRKIWSEWRDKYSQMINYTRDAIKTKLQWIHSDLYKIQNTLKLQFRLLFSLDEFDIILLQKIKNKETPFLRLQSSNIQAKINLYSKNRSQKQFLIHKLKVINLQEQGAENIYCNFLEMSGEDSLAVRLALNQYDLNAYNEQVQWNFTQKSIIHFNPLKIHITEQIYQSIYHLFFGKKPQQQRLQQQQLQSLIPDYYKQLIIEEVKVQIWYRTESRIKRLEGVHIQLQQFEMNNQFISREIVFERWVRFMIRQLASQFFNVIGQKLFG